MSYTYPHFASNSPVASYQSAHTITQYMENRLGHHTDNEDDEESQTGSSPVRRGRQFSYGSMGARGSLGSLGTPGIARDPRRGSTILHPGVGETAPLLVPPVAAAAFDATSYSAADDVIEEDAGSAGSTSDAYEAHDLTHDDSLLKEAGVVVRYFVPVFISQLLEYSLAIASVISIGHLGTVELAASTLGSMTSSVTGYSIVVGMVSALDALLPQAWGGPSENRRLVGLWTQRMVVVIAIICIPILIIWHSSYSILIFLRQDPEVASYASLYLKWISLALPAYSLNTVARKYFQSIGKLHVPSVIIGVVAPLNAVLNYVLVWGPGPFKPISLGFIGAPIASAISINFMLLCYIVYGIMWSPKEAWSPLSGRGNVRNVFSSEALGFLIRIGAAGVGQTASEWWSWELVGLAASLLGPVALASQSVLLVSASTSYQLTWSIALAAAVRIGNLVGAGHARQAKISATASFFLIIVGAGINSTIFLIWRDTWGYLFNNDVEVVALAARVLPVVAIFQVLDGLSAMSGTVLRVTGMQFTGALLNLTGYYIIGLPSGLVLTFMFPQWKLGLLGLWIGLSFALAYVTVVGIYYCLRTDWDEEVEKAKLRLKSGESTEVHHGH